MGRVRRVRVRLLAVLSAGVLLLATSTPPASPNPGSRETSQATRTVPADFTQGELNEHDRAELAALRAAAHGRVAASVNADGKARFLRVAAGGDLLPESDGAPAEKAAAFLSRYSRLVGAPADQLDPAGNQTDALGAAVTYTQSFGGVPVWGSEIRINFSDDDRLTSVNGFLLPDLANSGLALAPSLGAATAEDRALTAVVAEPPVDDQGAPADTAQLTTTPAELLIYPAGAVRGDLATPTLAWRVQVGDGGAVAEEVFLSAETGKLINRYSTDPTALQRRLRSAEQTLWSEGDAFPGGLSQERQDIVAATGDAYWFFENGWSRDAPNGTGEQLEIREDGTGQTIPCPNAAWTGSEFVYCPGMGADDVVAHEWGHAYTEHLSGLVYQWQPGALNEAYSDIWGETIDLINGRQDGDEGDLVTPRPDGCATASPTIPQVVIEAPASIAQQCVAAGASFGAAVTDAGTTAEVAPATDADEDAEEPFRTQFDGCSTLDDPAALAGRIVLVDRGGCPASVKADRAQDAGAVGLIVVNRTNTVFPLTGSDPSISIPAVSLPAANGTQIRTTAAAEPVTVTIRKSPTPRSSQYRWLLGEDTSVGPIRDLWRPACHGDPGSVLDAEYYCDTTDNGGVHTNSTVVSHAFALLVDGGTYGGVTVPAVGLDKAAAIYFRAEASYSTPLAGFADHADALEAACTSLLGSAAPALSTAPGNGGAGAIIGSADCTAVASAIAAVSLRSEPIGCGFGPMLAQTPDAPCGTGYDTRPLFTEDFTNGLSRWTQSDKVVYEAGTTWPWARVGSGPDNHGPAAYARATNHGVCSEGLYDVSSRNLLISPTLQFPADVLAPRLSFDHYVATEVGYDGGNIKIRQAGSNTWLTVPAHAYLTNPPPQLLTSGALNTNPLAGQAAFTGTDGGATNGSWGRSVIDLRLAGIDPEQPFQFAFDFGRDGCNGLEGWYVDNVEVASCGARVALAASQRPVPTAYGRSTRISVTATRSGTSGAAPTGTVQVTFGGRTYAAALAAGSAALNIPMLDGVGQLPVTVSYLPSGAFAPASKALALSVVKATPKLNAFIKAGTGRNGKPLVIVVQVTAPGTPVTGRVRLFKGSKRLGKAVLNSNGQVRFKVRGLPSRGKLKVTIKYGGSVTVAKSTRTLRIR